MKANKIVVARADGTRQAFASQGKLCEIWEMKTWPEVGIPRDGSFTQYISYPTPNLNSGGGVSANYVVLNVNEIKWLISLNKDSFRNWDWAAGHEAGDYFQIYPNIPNTEKVMWNIVGAASACIAGKYYREQMLFSERQNGFAKAVGIPFQASGDYSAFTQPFFVHNLFGNYWDDPLNTGPMLYRAATFDPASFPHSKGSDAMWIETKNLYRKVGTVIVPWLTPSPVSATRVADTG